ncbi:MAG: tRNA (guanosine(46)-N7)-methyltransferase TrmB [Phycisphaerae bacterium]
MAMKTDLDTVSVTAESLGDPADLRALFGNNHPIELEIGSGKGGFLLRQAKSHADRNYLGIEWANQYFRFSADRMARWGITNVRIMRTDARHFFIHRMPTDVLAALHVYHPDPWPKKRHHKRRLFSTEFVAAAVRSLEPGGRWAIQTDHAEYAGVIRERLSACVKLTAVPFDDADFGTIGERTETNFEIKYQREGRPIHRFAFRRLP